MSTTINYANANEAAYRAFVATTLAAFAKAGYKTATETSTDTNVWGGSREKTTIRVIFAESHNPTIIAYRNEITAAKAHITKVTAECNLEKGEFRFMDVANWAPMPFEAFDAAGNVVMEITGAKTYGAKDKIDSINYTIFELSRKADENGKQRFQIASQGKVSPAGGRDISPESTAKRAVKSIGESLAMSLASDVRYAFKYDAARIAEDRATKAATKAAFDATKDKLNYIAGLIPGTKQAAVDQQYGTDVVRVKLEFSFEEVRQHLVDKLDKYPTKENLIEAVVALIKSKSAN